MAKKSCPKCGCLRQDNLGRCVDCGHIVTLAAADFCKSCDICSASRSRKVYIRGDEKHYCYNCYVNEIMPGFTSSKKKYIFYSKADALCAKYAYLRREMLYYGDDVKEIDILVEIANDYKAGINPHNWHKIGIKNDTEGV